MINMMSKRLLIIAALATAVLGSGLAQAQNGVSALNRPALNVPSSIVPLTGPLDCIVLLSRSTRTSRVVSR